MQMLGGGSPAEVKALITARGGRLCEKSHDKIVLEEREDRGGSLVVRRAIIGPPPDIPPLPAVYKQDHPQKDCLSIDWVLDCISDDRCIR